MALAQEKRYTAEEFFALIPETNERCELIDGEIVYQASPSGQHQEIVMRGSSTIDSFIRNRRGKCRVFISLDTYLDDDNVVQPDILVNCDPNKYDGKRINGTPDLVIEVVSTNRHDDFYRKLILYKDSGVREYWIIDPKNEKTLVYHFEETEIPSIYAFDQPIPVGIYDGELSITVEELL